MRSDINNDLAGGRGEEAGVREFNYMADMSDKKMNTSALLRCCSVYRLVHDSYPEDSHLGPAKHAWPWQGTSSLFFWRLRTPAAFPPYFSNNFEAARSLHPEALSTVCCVVANGAWGLKGVPRTCWLVIRYPGSQGHSVRIGAAWLKSHGENWWLFKAYNSSVNVALTFFFFKYVSRGWE